MATSPLPRWAPTPSPSRPLWCPSSSAAGSGSRLLPPFRAMLGALRGCAAAPAGEAQPPAPPAGDGGVRGGTHAGFDGIIADHPEDDDDQREDIRLGGGGDVVFITWEDVWVTAVDDRGKTATTHHPARRQRQRAPRRGASHHGPLWLRQDYTARHLGR